ncbi:glycerol kinase GlpK [Caulobacter sp. S45]|uniref:glycerol kinase GlpK n=1 Tax=Caulobacter sp. S45 TaxID=1641861 RepID=UPI0015772FBB|nr:glycerol kinase GlpK [Caulobacter sp. S45]
MPAGPPLILAIDQGTTSSRALVFNASAEVVASARAEVLQLYPTEGWVEHDPEAIWSTTLATARQALTAAERGGGEVVAIGVTNQRETTIVWDRGTGAPIYDAIVWQDRRTAGACRELEAQGLAETVRAKSGLLLDPYFSAAKVAWILSHVDGARGAARAGRLAFGTVDSFLLWRLTGGRVHATDATNASRTSLYDIRRGDWCEDLCRIFDVPRALLPDVRDCSAEYGRTAPELFGRPIPILGVIGDQQAAGVGQCGFAAGDVKTTFGTGGFMVVNTGGTPVDSRHRLLSTVAYRLDGRSTYALEGSIFVAGAAVQWLRDGLGLIRTAAETEGLARSLQGNGGVYLVPAFTGLGAPHWDPDARGALFGLTRASGAAELARAALESACYQSRDLFTAVAEDGVALNAMKVDGGMAANDWMLQFLADVTDLPVERPAELETTALGAAYMARRACGVYGEEAAFAALPRRRRRFEPQMDARKRERLLDGWRNAVRRTLSDPR